MTMIERVARAMWAGGDYPDTWDEYSKNEGRRFQERWFKMAHAAIEAMRMPTRAMLGSQKTVSPPEAALIWDYMIEEATQDIPIPHCAEDYTSIRKEQKL